MRLLPMLTHSEPSIVMATIRATGQITSIYQKLLSTLVAKNI